MGKAILAMDIASLIARERLVVSGSWVSWGIHVGLLGINNEVNILSSWGRRLIVQKRRAALNDFDRFKLMLAKIKRGGLIRQELAKLKKENAA